MFNKPRNLELKFGPILGLQCKTSQLCFIFLHSTENETITNIVVQRQDPGLLAKPNSCIPKLGLSYEASVCEAYIKYKM